MTVHWGEMGLATVECSETTSNRREEDALTIKLNNELKKWNVAKQQADDAGDLRIWLSETTVLKSRALPSSAESMR